MRTDRTLTPPRHLRKATGVWWKNVVAEWELDEHLVRLLTLACEAWDRAEEARETLACVGTFHQDRFRQPKPHPAVAIERDGRIAFARLLRELDLDHVAPPETRVLLRGTKGATMPRRRRALKVRDDRRLTPGTPPLMNDKWGDLLTGFDFCGGYGIGAHRDEVAQRAAQGANREALMIACRERYGPGCRPNGWWCYEAPVTIRTSFARTDTWRPNQREPGALPPEYVALMARFGLLTKEERTALGD